MMVLIVLLLLAEGFLICGAFEYGERRTVARDRKSTNCGESSLPSLTQPTYDDSNERVEFTFTPLVPYITVIPNNTLLSRSCERCMQRQGKVIRLDLRNLEIHFSSRLSQITIKINWPMHRNCALQPYYLTYSLATQIVTMTDPLGVTILQVRKGANCYKITDATLYTSNNTVVLNYMASHQLTVEVERQVNKSDEATAQRTHLSELCLKCRSHTEHRTAIYFDEIRIFFNMTESEITLDMWWSHELCSWLKYRLTYYVDFKNVSLDSSQGKRQTVTAVDGYSDNSEKNGSSKTMVSSWSVTLVTLLLSLAV